ncbi:MAG: type II toxin-antitoxin system HigB family toxin [Fischerella sp.]|uniref:type II toxin-antitoxin system HigB family toxin n=1 Tax=Fischerella sp. TaxID=1191 RepID=UPI0017913E6E|nr:type II toxin-antitoxin system HigB family toxin [Fischerella sp.]NWF57845.1 type II toxin-antitoxin system HigB family toxin [Fischerella sp.]
MHVISRKALREFSDIHADAEIPLNVWYRIAKSATWKNIMDVKEVRPDADFVDGYTVFNIKGNNYRLITEINYKSQTIFIRHVFTHTEYDEGKWKK